jgi:hypothetical protein
VASSTGRSWAGGFFRRRASIDSTVVVFRLSPSTVRTLVPPACSSANGLYLRREKAHHKTAYLAHQVLAKSGVYKAIDNFTFVQYLLRRLDVGKDYKLGKAILGMELATGQFCRCVPNHVSVLLDASGSAA